MRRVFHAWLRFFRAVNIPTVPGDVLVGAAAVFAGPCACADAVGMAGVASAAAASVLLYMFGLADNDIRGAAYDIGRPIPDGDISMSAARLARALCLVFGFAVLAAGGPRASAALCTAFALCAAIMAYNRTKLPLLMGLCRGLNVLLGAAALLPAVPWPGDMCSSVAVASAAAVWTAYISMVTKYSEGEDLDPSRRRRVGALVGGVVYLQLSALALFALASPRPSEPRALLVAGAVLLLLLRVAKKAWPGVSAS